MTGTAAAGINVARVDPGPKPARTHRDPGSFHRHGEESPDIPPAINPLARTCYSLARRCRSRLAPT